MNNMIGIPDILADPPRFSQQLFDFLKQVCPAARDLEFYEFQYGLDNLTPSAGWASIILDPTEIVEEALQQKVFYSSIKTRPISENKVVLDEKIVRLTCMLFVGLVSHLYSPAWVRNFFYFDIRGFIFLPRTIYFTQAVLNHFGGVPYRSFDIKQEELKSQFEIGYKEYQTANTEVDHAFIEIIQRLVQKKGTPILLTIAGPTAAGKTEIVSRLQEVLWQMGYTVTSIEMDNFAKDKEYRDTKVTGKDTIHFDLFLQCMQNITQGKGAVIPRYDFYNLVSSHDLQSLLRPGGVPIAIEPADVIYLEGNFPFHMPELAQFLGIKIVYLADDEIRLKRKWKRDIDLRKKYEPRYFQNRFFQTQFLRAQEIYLPLMQVCEIVVDTSGAKLWLSNDCIQLLS